MVDSYQLLVEPLVYSFQYPLVYSLISSKLFYLFYDISGSMNISFFILSLIQLIFMSFIISYAINWSHKEFKLNKITFLIIFYFNYFIIFSNLNIAHLRDTLFSAFFILLFIIIYKLVKTNGECFEDDNFMIKLIITITGLMLTRNNGVLIVICLIIYFIIKFKKYKKQIFTITSIFTLIFCLFKIIPNNFDNSIFQESISVPFQQLAYSISFENVSDKDKEIISEIIPVDIIKKNIGGKF